MKSHPTTLKTREERFEHYLDLLGEELDHVDRIKPFREYITGLLLPGKRKSIEPMAAQIDPSRVCAKHQSLHHFIAAAAWSDRALLRAIQKYVLPALLQMGEIECWVVDDTAFPKCGRHSVGVARQYCGELGKTENCQVAVSLTLSHKLASLPIALDLYLPKKWANDWVRRKKAGVPREIRFRTKHEIALAQIDAALQADLPRALINADVGFGHNGNFRDALTARRFRYAMGIRETTTVWPPGKGPLPPQVSSSTGRPPKLMRRDAAHQPLTVRQLADQVGRDSFRSVAWREGARGEMRSHFCAQRVRPAYLDYQRDTPRAQEWLLMEWPMEEREPTKYWFLTLPKKTSLSRLVYAAKGRWPIERDYAELKDIGLGGYEVRGWRGFHHHATMCIAAYAFLIAERGLFSPSPNRRESRFTQFGISGGQRPHDSANTNGAAQSNFDCDNADRIRSNYGQSCTSMPVLPKIDRQHVIIS
jgi:SRSO17 transposase